VASLPKRGEQPDDPAAAMPTAAAAESFRKDRLVTSPDAAKSSSDKTLSSVVPGPSEGDLTRVLHR
jgi:hypothetical protein